MRKLIKKGKKDLKAKFKKKKQVTPAASGPKGVVKPKTSSKALRNVEALAKTLSAEDLTNDKGKGKADAVEPEEETIALDFANPMASEAYPWGAYKKEDPTPFKIPRKPVPSRVTVSSSEPGPSWTYKKNDPERAAPSTYKKINGVKRYPYAAVVEREETENHTIWRPPPYKKWKPVRTADGKDEIPEDWTPEELDLDEDDLDAHIKRCKERIEEGVMVGLYEDRLEVLNKEFANREKNLPEDIKKLKLPWKTIVRLEQLDIMRVALEDDFDKLEQMDNLNGVWDAYVSGELENNGMITYWSGGKRVGPPKEEFNVEQYMDARKRIESNIQKRGFWVEGFNREIHMDLARCVEFASSHPWKYEMGITLRLGDELCDGIQSGRPAGEPFSRVEKDGVEFTFMDDTGSSIMKIFYDDLWCIRGTRTKDIPWEHLMGVTILKDANQGTKTYPVFLFELNVYDRPKGRFGRKSMLPDWIAVPCAVDMERTSRRATRLSGPLVRRLLYQATAPESLARHSLYLSTEKDLLSHQLPVLDECPDRAAYLKSWPLHLQDVQSGGFSLAKPGDTCKIVGPVFSDRPRYPGFPNRKIPAVLFGPSKRGYGATGWRTVHRHPETLGQTYGSPGNYRPRPTARAKSTAKRQASPPIPPEVVANIFKHPAGGIKTYGAKDVVMTDAPPPDEVMTEAPAAGTGTPSDNTTTPSEQSVQMTDALPAKAAPENVTLASDASSEGYTHSDSGEGSG